MALRNFNEISRGKQYPPERERARVSNMDKWLQRYSRKFEDETRRLKPNSYRFICNFFADQVISTPPTFTYEGDARQTEALQLVAPSVVEATRNIVTDLIRHGAGVYTNVTPWSVGNIDPRFYFAIARPERGEYLGALTTLPYIESSKNTLPDSIAITTYAVNDTVATTNYHRLEHTTIAELASDPTAAPAMHPIVVSYGAWPYGTCWYEDVDEYVVDLHRRESGVSKALDRHTNPHLAIPAGSISVDAQGRATVSQEGMVIPINSEADIVPTFITWNAKF